VERVFQKLLEINSFSLLWTESLIERAAFTLFDFGSNNATCRWWRKSRSALSAVQDVFSRHPVIWAVAVKKSLDSSMNWMS
jgi:hypothetical protein